MTLHELQRAAEANGFSAPCYKFETWSQLQKIHYPAILHLKTNGGHFVAADRSLGPWIRIADPADDLRWRRKASLEASGYFASPKPLDRGSLPQSDPTGSAVLFGLLKDNRARISITLALSLAAIAGGLGVSQYIRYVIDYLASGSPSVGGLNQAAGVAALLAVVSSLFSYGSVRRAFTNSVKMERELALSFGRAISQMDASAFRAYSSGDFMARFADLSEIRAFIQETFLAAVTSLITLVAAGLLLALQSPEITLFLFPALALAGFGRWQRGRRLEHFQRNAAAAESQLSQSMVELVEGTRLHRDRAWGDYQQPRLRSAFDGLLEQARRVFRFNLALESGSALVATLLLIVAVRVLGAEVLSGRIGVGSLASLAVLLPMMTGAAFALAGLQQEFQRARICAERVYDIQLASRPSENGAERPGDADGDPAVLLQVSELRVATDGRQLAWLPGLQITQGEVLGLRGPNGGGKSTLCRVLAGLEGDWSGSIQYRGVPMKRDDVELQRHVQYVPESIYIAADTLIDNVLLGRKCEYIADIREVVGLDLIAERLPVGYATPSGPPYVTLSGGESQRIGIARALVARPDLLVLDEATRMLDVGTQRTLLSAILSSAFCRSIIIVSHTSDLDSLASRVVEIGDTA